MAQLTLVIDFAGFFECRLATDPDHFEEKRGVNGWTFATPEEPDLDRAIRFQPGDAVGRWPGLDIGVRVTRVSVNGTDLAGHVLLGAPVTLLDDPVFDGRNGAIAPAASEPIVPFHIQIAAGDICIAREMRNPATGDPLVVLAAGGSVVPELLVQAGITDPAAYREARRSAIETRLQTETDPQVRTGLDRRLNEISTAVGPALMWGPVPAEFFVRYEYTLMHPNGKVADPAGQLPSLATGKEWRFRCQFGAWDADVLSGFASGSLEVPLDLAAGV